MAVEPQPQPVSERDANSLIPTMGLGALVIYGVGDMLGAGVYSAIGSYAGKMGNAIWLAFLVSALAALFTGLSYASLGSRYPRAAGAAFVTQKAYGFPILSYVVGLAVAASGLTSFATASHAFAGYFLSNFVSETLAKSPMPVFIVAAGFVLILALINWRGLKESTWLNALCTAIEVGGLLLIIALGMRYWGGVSLFEVPDLSTGASAGAGISMTQLGAIPLGLFALQGAVLTFYSFIGFEDMMNVSEEVKDAPRTFPRGVMLALAITAVIYMAIAVTVISVVPWQQLADSKQPMVEVMAKAAPWLPPSVFSFVSMFAIANTALLNYIMGSRLIYGMARQGLLPASLGKLHPSRRTPTTAIIILAVIILILVPLANVSQTTYPALTGFLPEGKNPIQVLAGATSVLLLCVFTLVNGALIVLKSRRDEPRGYFEVPTIVPLIGALIALAMLGTGLNDETQRLSFLIAGGLLVFIGVLYAIMRPQNVTEETLAEAEHE